MANGSNTATILGGVGLLSKVIPADQQSTFQSAVDTAKSLTMPAPAPSTPAGASNASSAGPSPMAPQTGGFLGTLAGFARSKAGMAIAAIAVLALGYKLYKGRR